VPLNTLAYMEEARDSFSRKGGGKVQLYFSKKRRKGERVLSSLHYADAGAPSRSSKGWGLLLLTLALNGKRGERERVSIQRGKGRRLSVLVLSLSKREGKRSPSLLLRKRKEKFYTSIDY